MASIEIQFPKQEKLSQPRVTDLVFTIISRFPDLLDDLFSQHPEFDDNGHVAGYVMELTTKDDTDVARRVLDAEAAIRSFLESMGYVIGRIVMQESN